MKQIVELNGSGLLCSSVLTVVNVLCGYYRLEDVCGREEGKQNNEKHKNYSKITVVHSAAYFI